MTTLTIVIPTTGRESLERAKASAWATADDVIVVADGDESVPARVHVDTGCPGLTRNAAIPYLRYLGPDDWVGFLDDDDVLVPDVYRRVLDANFGADCVVMTMSGHPDADLLPRPGVPLIYGNVGISFAIKARVWADEPFIAGQPRTIGEDYELIQRLVIKGHHVVMSPEVAYIVRPEVLR